MTADDVGRLTVQTHDLMESALQSISAPSPDASRRKDDPSSGSRDSQTPRPDNAQSQSNAQGHAQDGGLRKRNHQTSSSSNDSLSVADSKTGNDLKSVDSRGGETTEDEMDEDAVLLKRPTI